MKSTATAHPDSSPRDTAGQVREWRFAQLNRAGFDTQHAELLADRVEVDLHQAVALVERGCDPEIAVRILL